MTASNKAGWRVALGLLAPGLIVVAVILLLWRFAPLKEWLATVRSLVDGLGPWGPAAFVLGYALAIVVLIPAAPLTLTAALIFGAWAFPLVVGAALLGATAAFLITRHGAREAIERRLRKHRSLRAIDEAIGEDGWKVVVLVRLSPLLPFNVQNYLLGLTRVGFGRYLSATLVGILPGTLLYVWLGAAGRAVLSGEPPGPAQWTLIGLGFVATLGGAALVTWRARQRLAAAGMR